MDRSKFLEENWMGGNKRFYSSRRPEVDSGIRILARDSRTTSKLSLFLREDWPDRVNKSRMSYIDRKRGQQRNIVTAGLDLVGRKVVIYDEVGDIWRLKIIKDCSLSWIDDGIVACVTHTLQVRCEL